MRSAAGPAYGKACPPGSSRTAWKLLRGRPCSLRLVRRSAGVAGRAEPELVAPHTELFDLLRAQLAATTAARGAGEEGAETFAFLRAVPETGRGGAALAAGGGSSAAAGGEEAKQGAAAREPFGALAKECTKSIRVDVLWKCGYLRLPHSGRKVCWVHG